MTRDDVARLAGVSTAVVSYVLNDGPRGVAPETRRRVDEAIRRLGYRPNRLSQAMAGHRDTGLIGVVVPDMRRAFLSEMVHALEQAASRRGFTVVVGNSGLRSEREPYYRDAFLGMRIAGLVVVGARPLPGTVDLITHEGTRVVQLYGPAPTEPRPGTFTGDETGSGRLATEHLLDHGHRDICFFAEPDNPVAAQRAAGWRAALADAGAHGRLFPVPGDRLGAYEAARELLDVRPQWERPTAVVCGTDEQALGVVAAARSLGIPVPGGLAVVGQDGIREAGFQTPALTTVVTAPDLLVRAALDALGAGAAVPPPSASPAPPGVDPGRPRLEAGGSCGCGT
ncbi:LacI family DNA-binding transcriptional regulator [Streptomyces sp. NPDC093510]|uniref:LacI family DNA-binding transcriptional regulator n=1 Tax=Streptomyces sp. NPDC093510 TaxID=3155199 RepID=UPI00343063DE